jgi:hypothetical protein
MSAGRAAISAATASFRISTRHGTQKAYLNFEIAGRLNLAALRQPSRGIKLDP